MGWFDGFPFKSHEQIDREKQDFNERVMQFGVAQRAVVLNVLREVMPRRKLRDEDRLFAYFSAKDQFTLMTDHKRSVKLAAKALLQQKWLTSDDRQIVIAMLILEDGIERLSDFPSAEQVREAVQAGVAAFALEP